MGYDPVAIRYAQAAFDSAKEAGEINETLEQFRVLNQVLGATADLRQLMRNPAITPDEKVALLDRGFKGKWSSLVKSCVYVMISLGRVEYLEQMIEAFSDEVDIAQGRLRVKIRSARPLNEASLKRVRSVLSHRENKEIVLSAELDETLLGGLQVVMGHHVIDNTVRRHIDELRQKLNSVRVH